MPLFDQRALIKPSDMGHPPVLPASSWFAHAAKHPLDHRRRSFSHFVLPASDYRPSLLLKLKSLAAIAGYVFQKLACPEIVACPGPDVVVRTSMPKAAIN